MASVLETFLYLFDSDAKKLAKDLDEATDSTDDLTEEQKKAQEQTEKLDKKFKSLGKTIATAAVSFIAYKSASKAIEIAQQIDAVGKYTDMLGLSVEKTEAWGLAVEKAGGDAGQFLGTLDNLNSKLLETSLTGTSSLIPAFNLLGINAVDSAGKARDAFDVLPEIAKSFESLTKAESTEFGRKLGLDDGTIRLMQSGRREMELLIDRQKRLGVLTKKETEAAAKFNDSLHDSGIAFRSLTRDLTMAALPSMGKFFDMMTDLFVWMRENKSFIVGFFLGITGVLVTAYLPAIISAAVATWAVVAPFLAVAAAVIAAGVAFALLYDDIVNFINGNDSLIGRFVDGWVSAVDEIKLVFRDMINELSEWFDWIAEKVEWLKNLEVFGDGGLLDQAGGAIANAGSSALDAVTPSFVSNLFNGGGGSSVAVGKVEVNTQATDADGIAADVGNSLTGWFKSAINIFDDGTEA